MASNPDTSLRDLEYNLKLQAELREALHILAKVSARAEERARSKTARGFLDGGSSSSYPAEGESRIDLWAYSDEYEEDGYVV